MRIIRVDPHRPDPAALEEAGQLLRTGALVAIPTETVYGLGANALDSTAVRRIFEAKGRPPTNPLIVHVPDTATARALAGEWPAAASPLAERFWPGPLTLVLRKRAIVPSIVTAGLDTIALRVPALPATRGILRAAGVPIAAPSANRSGELSPTHAEHVIAGLGNAITAVVDAGPTDLGIESTVLDLSNRPEPPVLLRPGAISLEELESVVGRIEYRHLVGATDAAQRSPGLFGRHYAPRARLVVLEPGSDPLPSLLEQARSTGKAAGAVVTTPGLSGPVIVLPADPRGYARGLYDALHRLDQSGVELIFVEAVPGDPAWAAIRDRLHRAAAEP